MALEEVQFNTTLIEQAHADRVGKTRELAAALECLRACEMSHDGRGHMPFYASRIEPRVTALMDELFPEPRESEADG